MELSIVSEGMIPEGIERSIHILSKNYDLDLDLVRSISTEVPEAALEWIVKLINIKNIRWSEDKARLLSVFEWFKQNKSNSKFQNLVKQDSKNHKNILDFTLHDLEGYQDKLSVEPIQSKRQQIIDLKKKGSKIIHDENGLKLLKVTDAETMSYYAKGTKWCVSDVATAEQYLANSDGFIVIFINSEKTALYDEASKQLRDIKDRLLEIDRELGSKLLNVGINIVYGKIIERVPEVEPMILKDANNAFIYARDVIKGRWSESEAVISKDAKIAYCYVRDVIKSKWPEGEAAISKDAHSSYYYAMDIIKDRWPEGEATIAQNASYAYFYAMDVIKDRWPEAEATILKDANYVYRYAMDVIKGRWPEGEATIVQNSYISYRYAMNVIKDRWLEAEATIAQDPVYAYNYAKNVIKGRWPEGEATIAQNPAYAYHYAKRLVKGRWPEGEATIAQDPVYAIEYKKF